MVLKTFLCFAKISIRDVLQFCPVFVVASDGACGVFKVSFSCEREADISQKEAVGAAAQNISWFIAWVLHAPYALDKCVQLRHWHRHVVESSALIFSLCVPNKNLLQ